MIVLPLPKQSLGSTARLMFQKASIPEGSTAHRTPGLQWERTFSLEALQSKNQKSQLRCTFFECVEQRRK